MMNDIIGSNPYRKNETMKLLGKQTCEALFFDEVRKQIHDIAEARNTRFDYNAAMDVFLLGYILAKKKNGLERKEEGNHAAKNRTKPRDGRIITF